MAAIHPWAHTGSAQATEDPFGPVIGAGGSHVSDHVPGTEIAIELHAGDVLTVGTCGVTGAVATGDTTLGLLDPRRVVVASNDDACSSLGSRIVHRAEVDGLYTLVLGCYGSARCGGRVAWSIGDEELALPVVTVAAALETRALVGPDGQAALFDAWAQARFDRAGGFVLRLSGSPMGIGGGAQGGILGGGIQLLFGWDLSSLEVLIGGGIATLSERPEGILQREVAVLGFRLRFGEAHGIHVVVSPAIGFFDEDGSVQPSLPSLDGQLVLPVDMVEIVARGDYGFYGVGFGEVSVVIWPEGSARRGVGVSVHAGGGALFYQPLCRFGVTCDTVVYAGPHMGLGLHVRP